MRLFTRLRSVRPEVRARSGKPTLSEAGTDASALVDLERRFGDVSALDNDKMEAMLRATARERGS
jgi:hypothetical protein